MERKRSCSLSFSVLALALLSLNALQSTEANSFLPKRVVAFPSIQSRGGSTRSVVDSDDEDDDEDAVDPEVLKRQQVLRKYRMEQQQLMQLRSTILSEALAKRGVPMITLLDVSTPEGQKPPEKVDWDCATSTEDEPKVRIYQKVERRDRMIDPVQCTNTTLFFSVQPYRLASTPLMPNPTRK
jgi:hypothetical protein